MGFPNEATQFKPGQSGNPAGKPKGRSVTARLRDLLDSMELGGKAIPNGKQVADLLAEVIIKNALKGDHKFVATVLDRTEGKVVDRTEAVDADGGPGVSHSVEVEFVDAAERSDEDQDSTAEETPTGL